MKKSVKYLVLSLLVMICFLGKAIAKDTVIVYTALENDEIVKYLALAKKELPGLDIKAIRLSTGELGARMLAERSNPQVDVVWGWAVTNMAGFVDRGMLEPYKPKNWDKIPANFKDPQGYWTAIDLYAAAFVINDRVLARKKLPKPMGWTDLLHSTYKDKLIMPNPASSGTGFLQIASLLVMMDADYKNKPIEQNKAWDFLKKLDKNMGQYIKSGSKPAKLTAAGEYAIGCSFAFVYTSLKKKGFPVSMVLPSEGVGFELEANALAKGAKHKKAAKKFLDWAISKSAMKEYGKFKLGVTYPGIAGPKGLPAIETVNLAPMDFPWQSKNREKILEVWSNLFLR
ncbi:MAG: ABC transporter substrate-binding protein [Deltaproteobacteria bacterium]|jgi:iron(III) transport system substrate-binding protein|nr:ABC transporter substrate-binding protein [Deltaproteobacteria bacterium]MBT4265814.1 ABC transporter substrate-binding protein [Deltaproteobacteria bacterium]MBT4638720.1 ABC transporter substrate-binding protein [Deltaproteobacteria bacterium]MBT6500924.1 ABC transporter substrate-binding protein [Deltaproteobacteria bacterium]MBT6613763.1 ABC transporter substrate-binding protein [Deltaproteobacteria bacterium]